MNDYHSLIDSCDFTSEDNLHTEAEIHTRQQLCYFYVIVAKASVVLSWRILEEF